MRSPVHHDNPDCNTGRAMEPVNRRPGREGKPLCAECARLNTKAHAHPRATTVG
ncbi:MAG: hypothetical protein V1757_08010 [Actinomycetota bacterium]